MLVNKTHPMYQVLRLASKVLATARKDARHVYIRDSSLYATDNKRMVQALWPVDEVSPEPGAYQLISAGAGGYLLQQDTDAPGMYDADRVINPVINNPYQTITASDLSYLTYRAMQPRRDLSMLVNVDFVRDAWDTVLQPIKFGKDLQCATVHLHSSAANLPLGLGCHPGASRVVGCLYLIMPMVLPYDEWEVDRD